MHFLNILCLDPSWATVKRRLGNLTGVTGVTVQVYIPSTFQLKMYDPAYVMYGRGKFAFLS